MHSKAFRLLVLLFSWNFSWNWKVGPHDAAAAATNSTKKKQRRQRKREAGPCSSGRTSFLGNRWWWHSDRRKAKKAYTMGECRVSSIMRVSLARALTPLLSCSICTDAHNQNYSAIFSSIAYEKFRTNRTDLTWEFSVSQSPVGKSDKQTIQKTGAMVKSGQRFRDVFSKMRSTADALMCRLDTTRRKKCGNFPSTQPKQAYTIDYVLEDWQ